MRNLPLLFCGIFFTLAFSWTGLILSSQLQFGSLVQTTETLDEEGNPVEGDPLFPQAPSGLAVQGKKEYISLGCVYCHSQQVRRRGFGADYDRGWGQRASVPRDYILEDRVLVGTMRTGPDLKAVGNRPLTRDWHLLHLYNPQLTSGGSTMPPYAFLFEEREIGVEPSPKALQFPPGSADAPPPGYEIVPTPRAEALVEYLLSLKLDYSLPEAPILD
jgi:cytochrome c oxidase cbb3-type subunit 2